MRNDVRVLICYMAISRDLKPPIVEIGSRGICGNLDSVNMRPFFENKQYIGCDFKEGLGVDKIEDATKLSFPDKYANTVLCLDTIEHITNPVKAVSEMFRILNDDGILILTTHMYAPSHMPDGDYWRVTPSCMGEVLLLPFRQKKVLCQGDLNYPHNVVGIGCKSENHPIQIDLKALNNMLPWPYPFPYVEYEINSSR